MGCHDPRCRRRTIRSRQGQAVFGVLPDGYQERLGLVAVEVLDLDGLVAAKERGTQTMNTVDDAHRRTVNQDRREGSLQRRELAGVLANLSRQSWRIAMGKRGDRDQ
jgi:hypothetical protein